MIQTNKTLAGRFHEDIFQRGRLEVADEILAPGFRWHAPGLPPEWQGGPQGVKNGARAVRAAFPDLQLATEDTIAEGNMVVNRWRMRATHQGEFLGIAPTGKQVIVTGIDIYRIEGGKLAEMWQNWDQLGLLQQLGAVPAPGQMGRQAA